VYNKREDNYHQHISLTLLQALNESQVPSESV